MIKKAFMYIGFRNSQVILQIVGAKKFESGDRKGKHMDSFMLHGHTRRIRL